MVLLGGAFVILVALLLSGSRGGIVATALGLFVLGALTLRLRKQQFAEQREAIIVVGALLVGAVFLVFGDVVVGKITQQGFRDESRMAVYMITMRSILAAPLLGYGYGTFADVFPMFRDQSVSTWGQWTMAHNTYLEVFQGLGLLFGSMLMASVVAAGLALRQRGDDAANERDDAVRGGERCLSLRCPFAGRLQPANAGHRHHVYGVAGGGCRSIREFSTDARGLEESRYSRGESPAAKLLPFQKASRKICPVAMRAAIRLLTAIAMIGICGFSVARGWGIVHFSLAMANIDSSEKRAEIINTWTAVPDVASTALRAELTEKINLSDPKAANSRREALSSILSIKPLSSIDWLSLSGMQLVTDQPMEQVLGSLKLSMLTGPNEGYVMAERGIFGVSIWDSLSPDLKSRVAVDLGPIMFRRTPAEGQIGGKIRAVLSAKPERVRNELREALLATGLSPKEIEQRLGF